MIQNFQWHVPKLLATGSKPFDASDAQWLIEQGFLAVLSLEDLPDRVIDFLETNGLTWCLVEIYDSEENEDGSDSVRQRHAVQEALDFVAVNLALYRPLFVHCSAGISRSVKLVKQFLIQNPVSG